MRRAIIVENHIIVNIIHVDEDFTTPGLVFFDEGNIGDEYIDGLLIPKELHIDMDAKPNYPYLVCLLLPTLYAILDEAAKERGYSNMTSLCTYENDPNPKYAAEAKLGIQYRSKVWSTWEEISLKMIQEEKVLSSVQLREALPKIEWPN